MELAIEYVRNRSHIGLYLVVLKSADGVRRMQPMLAHDPADSPPGGVHAELLEFYFNLSATVHFAIPVKCCLNSFHQLAFIRFDCCFIIVSAAGNA
jgi:hypothetical protein